VLRAGLRPLATGGLRYQWTGLAEGAGKALVCPGWDSEIVL